jgi:hypothetical protein
LARDRVATPRTVTLRRPARRAIASPARSMRARLVSVRGRGNGEVTASIYTPVQAIAMRWRMKTDRAAGRRAT